MKSRVVMQTADRTMEISEIDVPSDLEPGQALMRVEACGMCATDYEVYAGHFTRLVSYPFVPGHEPLGVIERITPEAATRWNVAEGDRVVLEGMVTCRSCEYCIRGNYPLCRNRFIYGHERSPSGSWLSGGYADYMVLEPTTVLHKISTELSPETAVLYNPLGGGFEWALKDGELRTGESVLILGPGQRGTACAIAASTVGARQILVSGVTADEPKLKLVQQFGATDVVNVDEQDLVSWVMDKTDGHGVDLVLDTVPYVTTVINEALQCVKRGGRIVLCGVKAPHTVDGFNSDELILKNLTMKGAFAVRSQAFEQAISCLEQGDFDFDLLHSHTLPLEETERAIQLLSGEASDGEVVTHVTIVPGRK